jgi:dolichol-phosphate mannosyltransferase
MQPLSVVVPVFENASDLEELVQRLSAVAAAVPDLDFELVFVDDGSLDGSFGVLTRLAKTDSRVKALRLSRNFGSNAALLAGLMHARGDAVVTLAADLQDPPELIPALIEQWRAGHQVVLAARRKRGDPFFSRVFAMLFNRLFRLLVFPAFPRHGFDFMLLDRQVVDVIRDMPEKNSYLFGQVMWAGFSRQVVHYDRAARARGRSTWTFWKKVKYFVDAFTAFSYLPVRAASLLGFGLAALGFAYAGLVVALRFFGDIQPRGFSALIVVIAVTAGVQLVVTGLIGEYVWRILEETRPRPPFVIASRINLPRSGAASPGEPR